MTDHRYLLDTGPLTGLLRGRPGAVQAMQSWVLRGKAATSVLVYGETVEYLTTRPDAAALRSALGHLIVEVAPLPLHLPTLERYAALRLQLRPPHGSGLIGDIDTLIAASALEHDLTVVTNDGDFIRVPGLQVLLLARRTFSAVGWPGP